jgi:hypothetical protein
MSKLRVVTFIAYFTPVTEKKRTTHTENIANMVWYFHAEA